MAKQNKKVADDAMPRMADLHDFNVLVDGEQGKLDMSDEKKILEYMKQGTTIKASNMMKIGEVIVNSEIVIETWKKRNS